MPILLQINSVNNWGSTGRIVEQIGQLALSKGWNSYVAYGRGLSDSQSELIRIGNKLDIYCHVIQTRLFDNHGLASTSATKELINKIQEIKPNIIHLHNIHGYYLNYKILFQYLAQTKVAVVWTLHDCWSLTGHCSYFSFIQCDKWEKQCFQCPEKRTYPTSYLFNRSKQNYKDKKAAFTSLPHLTIVPVSDWLAGLIRKSFLNKYPIHRIYNGVDLNVFKPRRDNNPIKEKLGITSKKMLLGVANVWTVRKGLYDYLALRQELPDDYVIVLIGLDEKQIRSLPKGVIGIKRTDNAHELAAYYSAADVVLNLSYEETFGLTTIEGLACGTPCVGYNRTATPELISENTGFVVEAGNIDKLLKAIEQVIKEKGNDFTVEQCRKRAERGFDKNDCYQEYLDLYEQLLKNK